MNYGAWVLDLLLVFPLLAAAIIMVRPQRQAKWIALGAAVMEFAISVPLWWAFDTGTAAMQFEVVHAWIPGWGIMYHLGLDGISLTMVSLTIAAHDTKNAEGAHCHQRVRKNVEQEGFSTDLGAISDGRQQIARMPYR